MPFTGQLGAALSRPGNIVVGAGASAVASAPVFPPRYALVLPIGLPLRGVPFRLPNVAPPPAPQVYAPLQAQPPVRGVPWLRHPVPLPQQQGVQPAAQVGSTLAASGLAPGAPILCVPWRTPFHWPLIASTPPPPPPPSTAPPKLPMLTRVQDADSEGNKRRLDRFTNVVANLVNSLVAQGILVQTGQAEWTMIPPDLKGLTGTFP